MADVEFDGGVRLRLTCDFYVDNHNTHQHGLEFHGDDGSLLLHSWQNFDSVLEMSAFREELRAVRRAGAVRGVGTGPARTGPRGGDPEAWPHRATGRRPRTWWRSSAPSAPVLREGPGPVRLVVVRAGRPMGWAR